MNVQSPKDRRHHGKSRSMGSNDPGTDHPVSGAHTQARQITVFSLGQVFFEIRPALPPLSRETASASSAGLFPASDRVAVSFGYILPGRFAFTRVAFPWQAGTIIKMLRHRVVQIQEPYNEQGHLEPSASFRNRFLHSCFFFQDKIDTECKYAMTEIIGMVDPVARQIHKRLPFQQPLP